MLNGVRELHGHREGLVENVIKFPVYPNTLRHFLLVGHYRLNMGHYIAYVPDKISKQ